LEKASQVLNESKPEGIRPKLHLIVTNSNSEGTTAMILPTTATATTAAAAALFAAAVGFLDDF